MVYDTRMLIHFFSLFCKKKTHDNIYKQCLQWEEFKGIIRIIAERHSYVLYARRLKRINIVLALHQSLLVGLYPILSTVGA